MLGRLQLKSVKYRGQLLIVTINVAKHSEGHALSLVSPSGP